MQRLFVKAFQEIESHPAWDGGLGISSCSSALRSSKVDAKIAEATCKVKVASTFGYFEKPVDNPPGAAIPSRSCHSKNWGACKLDRWLPAASNGVQNIYTLLKRWRISRSMLPVTTSISFNDVTNHYVLTDTFGR
eukprot:8520051-Pyramimonas_sp.AAC.1